ncbi:Uncharacterised protein [Serratia rubidaea]|uniref:Uncharacterized protein n=1 Tax=Serratia rubidaea TaxID=61652 RepID=A0A4U9HB06_SERRU|nr:Uncharacterised protein [Serratia rubidaea]
MNELTTKYFVAAQLNLEKFARDRRALRQLSMR